MDPVSLGVLAVTGATAVLWCAIEAACKPCLQFVRSKMDSDLDLDTEQDTGGPYAVV